MTKRAYLPLLMDRWTAGTQELTFEQRGFYISLLVWMYDTGSAVKDSDHAARILRCDKRTSRRLLAELSPKFRRTSAGLRHKVLDNLLRNGGRIKGLEINNFPTDPDPDPEEEKNPPLTPPPKAKPKPKPKPRSQPAAAPVPVVEGLDKEAWTAYEEYRRQAKMRKLKPPSVLKNQRWLAEQPDQAAVVDQTIRNGWTGLFELKTTKPNGADYDRPIRGSADWYAERDRERERKRLDAEAAGRLLEGDDGVVWEKLEN